MTRDIWLAINGIQMVEGQKETVETVSKGNYFKKNETHYILYEEEIEDNKGISRNTIKITPTSMEMIRRGAARTHMIFEPGKEIITGYQTSIGELLLGISTDKLEVIEKEELIEANVRYSLSINHEYISDCYIKVIISSVKMS